MSFMNLLKVLSPTFGFRKVKYIHAEINLDKLEIQARTPQGKTERKLCARLRSYT